MRLADTTFDPIRSLKVELERSGTKDLWFRDLLSSVANSTLREHVNLKIGYEQSTSFLSWACRNLLELSVIGKYVSASEKNAKRFADNQILDGIELFKSLGAWSAGVQPQRQLPGLEQVLARLNGRKAKAGLTTTKVLRANELAKSVGMDTEFRHMNKVFSKTVHPTAWSVLTTLHEGELKRMKLFLFLSGVGYGMQIYTTLRSHIDRFGAKPA